MEQSDHRRTEPPTFSPPIPRGLTDTKAGRRAARVFIDEYHETQLTDLIDRLRQALVRFEANEMSAFEFDDVVYRYTRASRELWKFCVGTGGHVLHTARMLEFYEFRGDQPDWWEAGAPSRRR